MTKNISPVAHLQSLAKKREQITTNNRKKIKTEDQTTVRVLKKLVFDVKRLILDYGEFSSVMEFVNEAISEKLEKERKKHN